MTFIFFVDWQSTVEDDSTSDYVNNENYEELLCENTKLKKEIAALKSSVLSRDLQIRQEMADTYMAMMKELETEWKYVSTLFGVFFSYDLFD